MGTRAVLVGVCAALAWIGLGSAAPAAPREAFMPNRAAVHRDARPWSECERRVALDVDFEGDGRPHRAEWWRCGPPEARWNDTRSRLEYPVDYLVVYRRAGDRQPRIVFDNAEEPGISHIAEVRRIDFGRDGLQELFVVNGIYGTGAAWRMCALGWVGARLACADVDDYAAAVAASLAPDESLNKALLREIAEERVVVEVLIAARGDPNCCPSRGSVLVDLLARPGRFATGALERRPPR